MSMVEFDERELAGNGNGQDYQDQGGGYSPPAVQQAGVSTFMADTGVITAQRVAVPRDDRIILQKLKAAAAMAGDDFYYRFPVKNRRENRTDWIEGPSIKCAMAVARLYGNCAVDCRAVDQGTSVQFLARFVDLETGFQVTRPFQQRKGQRTMGTDADRAADIVFQIGASKAMRNVICNALEGYANFAFQAAKANLAEKVGKNLAGYRDKCKQRLYELKVDLKRVEAVVGKVADEWLAPEVARLIAELQSVQDGMASAADLWPEPGQPEGGQTSKLDAFAGKTDHDPQTGEIREEGADAAQKQANASGAASDQKSAKKAKPDTTSKPEASGEAAAPAGPEDITKPFYDNGAGHQALANALMRVLGGATSEEALDELLTVPEREAKIAFLGEKAPALHQGLLGFVEGIRNRLREPA